MARIRAKASSGGGDNYGVTGFVSVGSGYIPTITTPSKAKAIFIAYRAPTSGAVSYTNVNPTSGEIDNNQIYYSLSTQSNTWTLEPGRSFVVTDNSITTSSLGGAGVYSAMYSY